MTDESLASRTESIHWLWVAGLAALALLALERAFDLAPPRPSAPPPLVTTGVPLAYAEALAEADRAVRDAEERVRERGGEWLMQEALARRYLARARLSGSFDDYAAADAALGRAFAVARPGTGPHMTRATLAFTMHRLAAAWADLDRIAAYAVPPDRGEMAEMAAMRGDILFYRGHYDAALAAYEEADRVAPGTAAFRRAVYWSRMGRPDRAEQGFDQIEAATRRRTPQGASALELQRGILDLERGRWDDALAHFTAADRFFPGHWLVEEHIAEVLALKGDTAGAEARYRAIIHRTGSPEFMGAMERLALGRGDRGAAVSWARRAAPLWARRLRQFPEAAYGHAVAHCIAVGNWACALDLARRNHENRPYGEAKELLAKALLHSGRPHEAEAMIEAVLASPWRTAQTHEAAAQVYRALGQRVKADLHRAKALAMNPHAIR